jgi:hypothetical protein
MDERDQLVEGALVALSPFDQQPGDVRRGFGNVAILVLSQVLSHEAHGVTEGH